MSQFLKHMQHPHTKHATLAPRRDDCASTMSFATERSMGSTQCSAPVLLTEVPAPGRGSARVGALGLLSHHHAHVVVGGGGGGGMLAFASMGAGGMGGLGLAGCEVQEECSREQLEDLMRQLKDGGAASSAAGSSSGGGGGDGGSEEAAEARRAAAVTLALHAERDAELRAAMVAEGLLEPVAEMLEVRGGGVQGGILVLAGIGCRMLLQQPLFFSASNQPAASEAPNAKPNQTHQIPPHSRQGADLRSTWAAAHIAWYVSRSDELRAALGGERVIAALVSLLGAPDPAVARAAALALNNLALEAGSRRRMADAGAINALIDMVGIGSAEGAWVVMVNGICCWSVLNADQFEQSTHPPHETPTHPTKPPPTPLPRPPRWPALTPSARRPPRPRS